MTKKTNDLFPKKHGKAISVLVEKYIKHYRRRISMMKVGCDIEHIDENVCYLAAVDDCILSLIKDARKCRLKHE